MKTQDKNPALLPSGFEDLLPPKAQQEAQAIDILMGLFGSFGYDRVKPPLLEFEDSLLAPGPGSTLGDQTFRLMDPVSSRMMGLRADITAQIARIVSSRLAGQERPFRLSYAGDVLRTKGGRQRTERQFCQVGCELVGRESHEADIEVCLLPLLGLSALGIEGITVDLNLPRVLQHVFEQFSVQQSDQKEIKDALTRRDMGSLSRLDEGLKDVLQALLDAAGPGEKALAAFETLDVLKEDFEKLKTVYEGLLKALDELGLEDVAVTVDVTESKGFEYHNGVGFVFFSGATNGELGRGGRYDVQFGAQAEPESATGFTLYMDTVCSAMRPLDQKDRLFVSAGESWATIRDLQNEGWIVVRGTGQNKNRASCTHEYKDGKIQEIG